MARSQMSAVPDGFKEQMNKLLRTVLLNRPVEPIRFFADFLEAELDRRTLYDLQMGRHTIRRGVGRNVEMSKTESAAELVSADIIRTASKQKMKTKKESKPKVTDKPRQKRPVKATPLLGTNVSSKDANATAAAEQQVPVASFSSKDSGESKTTSRTKRKSKEDPERKSTKTLKRKSKQETDSTEGEMDAEYFENYFLSPKPNGPIFVPDLYERETTTVEEEEDWVSGIELWNRMEEPEVNAMVVGSPQGSVFSFDDVSGLTTEEPPSLENDGTGGEYSGFGGPPKEKENEEPPSFHGFEEGLNEGLPVSRGLEGQESSGTDSGQAPPVLPDSDRELPAGTETVLDEKQQERESEEPQLLQGFEQEQGGPGESSVKKGGDTAGAGMDGESTTLRGEEIIVPSGQEIKASHEEIKMPDEEIKAFGEEIIAPGEPERTSPDEEITEPGEELTAPAEEIKVLGDEAATVAEEIKVTGEEFKETGDDTTAPAKEDTTVVEEIKVPGEEAAAPSKEIKVPAEDITAPVVAVSEPTVAVKAGTSEIAKSGEVPNVLVELDSLDHGKLTELGLLVGTPTEGHGVDDFEHGISPVPSIGVAEILHPALGFAAAVADAKKQLEEEEEEEIEERVREEKKRNRRMSSRVVVDPDSLYRFLALEDERRKSARTSVDFESMFIVGTPEVDEKMEMVGEKTEVVGEKTEVVVGSSNDHPVDQESSTSSPAPPTFKITEPPEDAKAKDAEEEEEEDVENDAGELEDELKLDYDDEGEAGASAGEKSPSKNKEKNLLSPEHAIRDKKKKHRMVRKASMMSEVGSEPSFVRILPSNEELCIPLSLTHSSFYQSDESFPFIHVSSGHDDPKPITVTVAPPPPPATITQKPVPPSPKAQPPQPVPPPPQTQPSQPAPPPPQTQPSQPAPPPPPPPPEPQKPVPPPPPAQPQQSVPPPPPPPPPPPTPAPPPTSKPVEPTNKPSSTQQTTFGGSKPPTAADATDRGRLITVDGLLEQVMVLENTRAADSLSLDMD